MTRNMFFRRTLAAATAGVSLVALAACGSESTSASGDDVTIGFAVPVLANPYWKANVEFATKMADQMGVELVVADAGEKQDTQLKNVQDLIAQGVDGIVFGPITAEIGPRLLQACENANIQCAAMARKPSVEPSDATNGYYAGYVVADDAGDGAAAAEALVNAGVTKAVAMSGLQGNSVANGRLNGFTQYAEANGLELLGTHRPVELPKDGLDATKNFLAKLPGPAFDGVFAFNDGSALGAIQALSQAGALDKVKVASIDGTSDGVAAVERGQLLITPGGEFVNGGFATIMVYDAIMGNPRDDRSVVLNVLSVTRDNVAEYKAQFIDQLPDYDARKLSKTLNPKADDDVFKIVLK